MGEKDHAISLLYYDNQATFTLTKFEEAQSRQANYAREKLAKLRVKVVEIVKGACEVRERSGSHSERVNISSTLFYVIFYG